mgnify:CR=1 FL=1
MGDEDTATAPADVAQPDSEITADTTQPEQPVAPEDGSEGDTETAALSPQDGGRVTIGTPATTLSIAQDAPVAADRADVNPLEDFAATYEERDGRPLMSIILIDDGQAPGGETLGASALSSFPYPLTFAIDAVMEDAPARMADASMS